MGNYDEQRPVKDEPIKWIEVTDDMRKLNRDLLSTGETRGLLMECSNSNFNQSKYLDGDFLEAETHRLGYTFETNTTNIEHGDVYTAPYTGFK